MPERSMPVCLTEAQHRIITEYAKRRGMTDAGQAIEAILDISHTEMTYAGKKTKFSRSSRIHVNGVSK